MSPGYYRLLHAGFIDRIVWSLYFLSFVLCDWFANIFFTMEAQKGHTLRLSLIRFYPCSGSFTGTRLVGIEWPCFLKGEFRDSVFQNLG